MFCEKHCVLMFVRGVVEWNENCIDNVAYEWLSEFKMGVNIKCSTKVCGYLFHGGMCN